MTVVVAVACWAMVSLVATPIIGAVISREIRDCRIVRRTDFRPEPVAIRLAAQRRHASRMECASGLVRRHSCAVWQRGRSLKPL